MIQEKQTAIVGNTTAVHNSGALTGASVINQGHSITPYVDFQGIPLELQSIRRWVGWRLEGKHKRPFDANGYPADVTNPRQWSSFRTIARALELFKYDGVGLALADEDDLIALDLDKVYDEATGKVYPWASGLVSGVWSYTEHSPSHTGLRIFARCPGVHGKVVRQAPEGPGKVELFMSGFFVTVTGKPYKDVTRDIFDRSSLICAMTQRWAQPKPETPTTPPPVTSSPTEDDAQLVRRMLASREGQRIGRLWDGDTTQFPDRHTADWRLVKDLLFWTGGDAARVDRLFRQSGLYRPEKWDRVATRERMTYGELTILKALESGATFYTGKGEHTGGGLR